MKRWLEEEAVQAELVQTVPPLSAEEELALVKQYAHANNALHLLDQLLEEEQDVARIAERLEEELNQLWEEDAAQRATGTPLAAENRRLLDALQKIGRRKMPPEMADQAIRLQRVLEELRQEA